MDPWEQFLAERGYHLTEARSAVIEVLRRARAPLLPQEILPLAKSLHSGLGLATVYRTVRILRAGGLLRRVQMPEGCAYYLPVVPGQSDLVVCESCGRAQDYTGLEAVRLLVRQAEIQTGYIVSGHVLQLSGLCPECARRAAEPRPPARAEGRAWR